MTSKCKQCGEQIVTGNYSCRILPSKRMPKKAMKLYKAAVGSQRHEHEPTWTTTKFRKFILSRTKPANIMELTCGKCGGVSRFKMQKNRLTNKEVETNEETRILLDTTKKSKLKSKPSVGGISLPSTASGGSTPKKSPAGKQLSKVQRKRQLDNLNKMLFSSKKAKKTGSTLQDFLSSI